MKPTLFAAFCFMLSAVAGAQPTSGLCMLSDSHRNGGPPAAQVVLSSDSCGDESDNCNTQNTSIDWDRWSRISADALGHDAALTATLHGDAGELTCTGQVHERVLSGRYQFQPDAAFLTQMHTLGFDGITPQKQLAFLMLDITAAWVKQMQQLGVTGMTTSKLISLRALHVDPDYIHAMNAAGFPELNAGRLTEMKAVGVTPQTAREAKELGFSPTEHELVQMAIFHIDRPFVERMRARGLTDLTLEKLIKIRIFKVAE